MMLEISEILDAATVAAVRAAATEQEFFVDDRCTAGWRAAGRKHKNLQARREALAAL